MKRSEKINSKLVVYIVFSLLFLAIFLLPRFTGYVVNETLSENNITVNINETQLQNGTVINNLTINGTIIEINESNLTIENNITEIINPKNITNFTKTENDEQVYAEVGKPVKWVRHVEFENERENPEIDIPGYAKNIKVIKIDKENELKIVDISIDGVKQNDITGNIILNVEKVDLFKLLKELFSFTGYAPIDKKVMKKVRIEDKVKKIDIHYETPGPVLKEEVIDKLSKRVIISSEFEYKNVVSSAKFQETAKEGIKLYWINNGSKELFNDVKYLDENGNGLIDKIKWIIPHLSDQEFIIELTILNVQSYPVVGGNWNVFINTSGTANLTVTAFNGTTYAEIPDNESTTNDLEFIELKCGDNLLNPEKNFVGNNLISLSYLNYSCNKIGEFRVKVLTTGKHNQEFKFRDLKKLAFNDAQATATMAIIWITPTTNANIVTNTFNTFSVNVSCSGTGTCGDINVTLDPFNTENNYETPDDMPKIINSFLQPTKVVPGDVMLITSEVKDNYGIEEVYVEMPYDNSIDIIKLKLVSGTIYNGIWENNWTVHDTKVKEYTSTFTATNILGKKSSSTVIWSDPAGNTCTTPTGCACGSNCNGRCSSPNGPEPVGDNVIDSCTDGTNTCGSYMWVQDIYVGNLNRSDQFFVGDTINVTMDTLCYSSGTEISMAYNNGSGWISKFYGNCPLGGNYNFSQVMVLNNVAGIHTVRAQESWTMDNTEAEKVCDSADIYHDADDVNLTVVSTIKGVISTTAGATPFYTTNQNPSNSCTNLEVGKSCVVTWSVNATGVVSSNWTFFAYANSTNDTTISNITNTFNITIASAPPLLPANWTSDNCGVDPDSTDKVIFRRCGVSESNGFYTIESEIWTDNKTTIGGVSEVSIDIYGINGGIPDSSINFTSSIYNNGEDTNNDCCNAVDNGVNEDCSSDGSTLCGLGGGNTRCNSANETINQTFCVNAATNPSEYEFVKFNVTIPISYDPDCLNFTLTNCNDYLGGTGFAGCYNNSGSTMNISENFTLTLGGNGCQADNIPGVTPLYPRDNQFFNTNNLNVELLCNISEDSGLTNVTLYTNISHAFGLDETEIPFGKNLLLFNTDFTNDTASYGGGNEVGRDEGWECTPSRGTCVWNESTRSGSQGSDRLSSTAGLQHWLTRGIDIGLTKSAAGGAGQQGSLLSGGKRYTISGWITTNFTAAGSARLYVNSIGSTNYYGNVSANSSWTYINGTFTVTSLAAGTFPEAGGTLYGQGGYAFFDEIQIEMGDQNTTYYPDRVPFVEYEESRDACDITRECYPPVSIDIINNSVWANDLSGGSSSVAGQWDYVVSASNNYDDDYWSCNGGNDNCWVNITLRNIPYNGVYKFWSWIREQGNHNNSFFSTDNLTWYRWEHQFNADHNTVHFATPGNVTVTNHQLTFYLYHPSNTSITAGLNVTQIDRFRLVPVVLQEYKANFSKTNLQEGTYIWNCQAYDNALQQNFALHNFTFTIDATNPITDLLSPSNNTLNTTNHAVSFFFNFTEQNPDNASLIINGVLNRTINLTNSQAGSTLNITVNLTRNGEYNWSVNVTDKANNIRSSDVFNLTVSLTGGNQIPSLRNYTSNQTIIYNGTLINFSVDLSDDNGLSGYVFSINQTGVFVNSSFINLGGVTGVNISNITRITSIVGTNVSWQFIVNDTNGAINVSQMQSFILNSLDIQPAVNLIYPPPGYNFTSNNVSFNCTATDDSNLVNITLWGNWTGTFHQNQSFNTPGLANASLFNKYLPDGNYLWNCQAFDNASQQSFFSSNYTFSIFPCNPPLSGSWNVNDTIVCRNRTIVIDKNVTIHHEGNLTIINVNLSMNGSYADGLSNVYVNDNGSFYVITSNISDIGNKCIGGGFDCSAFDFTSKNECEANSPCKWNVAFEICGWQPGCSSCGTITNQTQCTNLCLCDGWIKTKYELQAKRGSNLSIYNSSIERAGWASQLNKRGFEINTSSEIYYTNFTNMWDGLILYFGNNKINNTRVGLEKDPLESFGGVAYYDAFGAKGNVLNDNNFTKGGLFLINSSNSTFINNIFLDPSGAVSTYVILGKNTFNDTFNGNKIDGSQISATLNSLSGANHTIYNNTFLRAN